MKTIVYYDCLPSIVLLNFIMDGGALFRVLTETRTRVLTEMSGSASTRTWLADMPITTLIRSYHNSSASSLREFFKDSDDGMEGLTSVVGNALNN